MRLITRTQKEKKKKKKKKKEKKIEALTFTPGVGGVAPGAASCRDTSVVAKEGEGGPMSSRSERDRGRTEYELEREKEREPADGS